MKNQKNHDAIDKSTSREKWSNKLDFIFSCVGYAIGLGNVWRFPYLCYKNGGGAFLIPYAIALIFGGIPMFFLEVALGQYMSQGSLGIWKISPIFKGVGYATVIMSFWLNCYYIVVLAWALYYFYNSFNYVLPWTTCNNWWNSVNCIETTASTNNTLNSSMSSTDEFWQYNVLRQSSGMSEIGGIRWELAICLFFAWVACYFCIWKGIKWAGKVVYFTSMFPYVLLLILLGRGITLDGAWDGIKYLFIPDWTRLQSSEVWVDAATQIFFSYGLGVGAITAFGSYNKFKNNCYRDTLILSVFNEGTCMLASLVIFSVLGFMAKLQGKSIQDVAASGPGLAFSAYPSALSQLPISPFWSVLFFLMLMFVGLDSQFGTLEGFITAMNDEFPILKRNKEIFVGFLCIISYLIGLSTITEGGIYIFNIFNTWACAGWALLSLMFFECIGVSWCYGADRFYDNINEMIGYYPGRFWKLCWTIFTPLMCFMVVAFSFIQNEPFSYKSYSYPWYGTVIGWVMALSSVLWIPLYAIYKVIINEGNFRDILSLNQDEMIKINKLNKSSERNLEESVAML